MDVWLIAGPIHNFLYGSSVFLSFVYVGLKLRDFSTERNHFLQLLLVVVAGSFFLCESFKSIVSCINDSLNHPGLMTWLENWESGDHEVQSITTESALGRWLHSQLICFVLPFITFINIKSRFIRMPTLEICAYVWLALVGAVSVAFPLFLLRHNSTIKNQTKTLSPQMRVPTWGMDMLGICLWISFWCTASLPWSMENEAKIYLSLVRLFLLLPCLIPATRVKDHNDHFMPLPIYCALVVLITGFHWYQSIKVITGENSDIFHRDRAIICDFALCFSSLAFYIFDESKKLGFLASLAFVLLIPFLSLGSTFSLLAVYEVYLHKGHFSTGLKEE